MHMFYFIAVLTGLPSASQQAEVRSALLVSREAQWLYREKLGNGEERPTAVFLSWDYSAVVLSATCDRRTGELVLRSEIETGPDAPAAESLEISSGSLTVVLRTTERDGYFEGRTLLTDELSSIFRSVGDLEVFVPTEMGEPFYVGQAEPLRRLGLTCGK